jgi:hypothetical protein
MLELILNFEFLNEIQILQSIFLFEKLLAEFILEQYLRFSVASPIFLWNNIEISQNKKDFETSFSGFDSIKLADY